MTQQFSQEKTSSIIFGVCWLYLSGGGACLYLKHLLSELFPQEWGKGFASPHGLCDLTLPGFWVQKSGFYVKDE